MRTRLAAAFDNVRDKGASAVEYGLMVAAIAAVIATIVFGFGHMLENTFRETSNCLAATKPEDATPGFPNCPGPDGR